MRAAFIISALVAFPAWADPHPEAKRVLAIGGSVTETIYALGQQDRLIARDTTSIYPPEAEELPDVGYMRALSPEGVLSVAPDLIIAEADAGPPDTIAILKEAGIPFETIPAAMNGDELVTKIEVIAETLGVPEAAKETVDALRADLDRLAGATDTAQPKRVLFILSLTGGRIMAAGQETGADAIISMAGGVNAVERVSGYKPLTDEAISTAAPDVILMMDRGDDSDHGAATKELLSMPAIATTPAGQNAAVVRMDGLYLLGFGPRTGKAALDLHTALYGDP